MTDLPSQDVTQLLTAWNAGDAAALERLIPIVEGELRRLAASYMRHESPDHTLQTTALVNEAYLKLAEWRGVSWQNRAHFFGMTARLMRQILVDHARARRRLKRGGEALMVSLEHADAVAQPRATDVLALDEALRRLAQFDARKNSIVELRCFGGLSVEETAKALQISPRTVMREWSLAQAWLFRELYGEADDER